MSRKIGPAFLLVGLLFCRPGRATFATLDARAGSDVSSENLSTGGDFGDYEGDEPRDTWNWSAGLGHNRTVQDGVADDSVNGRAGVGWTSASQWSLYGQGQYGKIQAEDLTQAGLNGTLAYELDGGRHHPDSWVRLGVTLGTTTYAQAYSGTKKVNRKRTVATHGEVDLNQKSISVDLSGAWWAAFSLDVSASAYSYGQNLNVLYDQISTPAALRRGLGGVGNTVGGFPRASISFGGTWYVARDWRLVATQTFSNLAIGGENSRSTEVLLGYNLTRRTRLSLGVERDLSQSLNATLGVVTLRHRF